MELQIISRETIKPSSPTPSHLRSYKLSLLDQLAPSLYMPMIFFYPNEGSNSPSNHIEKVSKLKNSLSDTLTLYYPFAGRLSDDRIFIDCNDAGIEFFETRMECHLSELVKKPEGETLNLLLPTGLVWNDSWHDNSLVGIQASFFECGGMAISVCILHNIADASTMSKFLNDWGAMSRESDEQVMSLPQFIATYRIIPLNVPYVVPKIELEGTKCVTRRFLFKALKIANLKALASDSGVKNPTRVQVVAALLYKCALQAANKVNSGLLKKKSVWIQLVNMRRRMDPPLATNSIGNFSWYYTISADEKEIRSTDIKFHELVNELKNGLTRVCDKNVNNMKVNDWLLAIHESTLQEVKILFDDLDVYRCSSLCKLPLYQIDFGWGKPIWVCMTDPVMKNTFVFIDTPEGDGIEAMVTLEEQDMDIFQHDEELLAFASLYYPLA